MFHENALASAFPVACCGFSERTTIKWNNFLTFRRFPAVCCRELQLLSRDHETGNPLAGLSGAERARKRWACHTQRRRLRHVPGNRPAAPRDWFRGVPQRYVAGADTQGRQEGRPYPWSQQVIHEMSGLDYLSGSGGHFCERLNRFSS